MTIDDVIHEHPWMEAFRAEMHLTCYDCGVALGEPHRDSCDVARCSVCGGQRLICECPDSQPDRWMGLMYPNLHKIALENDLWCRTLIVRNGKEEVLDFIRDGAFLMNEKNRNKIRWHVLCQRNDPGARADLNRAGCLEGS